MYNHECVKRFVAFVRYHTATNQMVWSQLEQCEYTTEFQGRKYRINCCSSNCFFVVDGQWLQVPQIDIDNICCDIGKQQGRLLGGYDIMDAICGNWQP